MLLGDTVRAAAARYGERPAVVMVDGPTLTYRELDDRSDRAAASWSRQGIGRGSVVVLRMPSDLGYVVAYGALSKLGAAVAGLNPSLAAPEQDRLVEHLVPDIVVTADDVAAASAGTDPLGPAPPSGAEDEIAAIVFTSGTTGRPKAAVFRDRHLAAIARLDVGATPAALLAGPEIAPPAAQLSSTQFAHVGFMTKLPWYLATGLTTHVLGRWRADDVIALIERERIATLGAIAPQIALLLRSARRPDTDLASLRTLIVGGAASPPALVADTLAAFPDSTYSIRYSSTESGGVGLANDMTASSTDGIDTIGRPRPGVEVRMTGEGELCLRSDAVFDGYRHDPEATASTLRDGWLHTGDLAEFDADGRVRLVGRRSDMFIRGGYNVHPAEVEAALGTHPGVSEVVVVPRPDPVMGEIGVAVVVAVDPSHPPALGELREHGASRLARWKLPEALAVLDAIPLTPVSKPDRVALRRLVIDAAADGAGSSP